MKRKKQVLLIIESSTGFGRGIFRGITKYVRETNHWRINIENRGFDDPLPDWLADWPGDGIISRSGNGATLRFLRTLGRPVVELHGDRLTVPEVSCDQNAIARLAADHLLESGLKHIAFYSYGRAWWLEQRRAAFVAYLAERGIKPIGPPEDFEPNESANPVWRVDDERRLAAWLKKLPRPVGVFTGWDPTAIRVVNACGRLGLAVPEEVAVLGAGNDVHLCEAMTPTLSSVDLDPMRIGYEAARRLDEKMACSLNASEESNEISRPIFLSPAGLTARESTDVIRSENADIAQAIRMIRDNALSGLKVSDVVERLNISAKTLQRGVRALLGRTPEQELIRLRMAAATEMLKDSRISVAEIALRCGFSSTKYFVNAFRRQYRTTPNGFRRETATGRADRNPPRPKG